MFFHSIRLRHVISIGLGIALLVMLGTGFQHYSTVQQDLAESQKKHMRDILENHIRGEVNEVKTIGHSLVEFYRNSETVTNKEFESFVSGLFDLETNIVNVFFIEDNKILNSYPSRQFEGKIFSETFPSFPVSIDGSNMLSPAFPVDDGFEIVLIIPFEYFLNQENIALSDFRLVLKNPTDTESSLYQLMMKDSVESDQVIRSKQLDSAIVLNKQTDLFDKTLNSGFSFNYVLWANEFDDQVTLFEIIVFGGSIVLALVIPVILYRSEKLNDLAKKRNRELQVLNKRLKKIDKAKEEFDAMITHELKTPLVPIIGYTKMLKKPQMVGKLNEEQKSAVDTIQRNATRLDKLIGDILDARKLEMGKLKLDMEDISSTEFLENLQSSYDQVMRDKNVAFAIHSEKNIIFKADSTRLRQVFDNLISNALKFVPDDGGKIEVGSKIEEHKVVFYVKDNGPGIPQENQKQLFKKFYQVDTSERRKVQGTGLGLAICKRLIEQMGGKLWIESSEKTGTTFYFSL